MDTTIQSFKTELTELEAEARQLEPSEDQRLSYYNAAWEYSSRFINSLPDKKAYVESSYHEPVMEIQEGGNVKMTDLLRHMDQVVDTPGINPASPGHFGYIPGGGIYVSAVADYLAAITNRYAGLYYASPGAVKMENLLIRWTADLVNYPETTLGNITSGGSIANLIAVTTARDSHGITPEKIGRSVVYYTQQTHHCVDKAFRVAGLSTCPKREIKINAFFRMDPADLERQILKDRRDGLTPFFIAASAGSTDTGAADPLEAIADISEKYGLWLHLDAAYGGFFIMVDELKPMFRGIERTDSIVLDPHKSLFLPYGIGIVLVKNGKALFDSQYYTANYLQDAYNDMGDISPCDLSPELTKHFRGLRMWLPLQIHGIGPFRAALKEKWLLTRYFHTQVQKLGFEVGPVPDLSVAIYRYVPKSGRTNEFNQNLVKRIQEDGRIFVSSTNMDGIFWLRIAIVCFRTHLQQVDLYLGILRELINDMEA